jgi:hypothetical protein
MRLRRWILVRRISWHLAAAQQYRGQALTWWGGAGASARNELQAAAHLEEARAETLALRVRKLHRAGAR